MNAENARKVIAALRSGEHKQTTGRLENAQGERCCLGVTCRVAIAAGVPVEVTGVEVTGFPHVEFDNFEDVLPSSVQDWLDVDESDPTLVIPDSVREAEGSGDMSSAESAVTLNDDYGLTFDLIADCLEATLAAEAT